MSTKAHILNNAYLEVYNKTSEPQDIFGKFTGFNIYMIIENNILKSFKLQGEYIHIEVKEGWELPPKFKIWGGNVINADWNSDGLLICIKGGTHTAKAIEKLNFDSLG